MKLSQLCSSFTDKPSFDGEITDLTYDSRTVKPGNLFFAVPGFRTHGNSFLEKAFGAGAAAAIVEDIETVPAKLRPKCILVPSVRRTMAEMSAEFFSHPSRNLLLVGVTGTKGKTSTTFLIESILKEAALSPALIGGVVLRHARREVAARWMTTPESVDVQRFLRESVDAGARSAVLEVSSHALMLDRTFGCEFDAMVFTNLSEDHLDFHKTMDAYYAAKKLLFTEYVRKKNGKDPVAAICTDSSYGKRLMHDSLAKSVSFGTVGGEDFHFEHVAVTAQGISGGVVGPSVSIAVHSPLVGVFNVGNILGAIAVSAQLGIPSETIRKGVDQLLGISGRMERVPTCLPFQVFVDFAHMGIALENVLKTLRTVCDRHLIVVFGAGGDKDPARRAQLGRVSARMAEFSVITSDNPRSESPERIIAAIESAYLAELEKDPSLKQSRRFRVEPDRQAAIRLALRAAKPGDVVCIAGKGHETGQEVSGVVHPFDDRIEAAKILREIEVDTP